jgi:integrase
MSGSLRQRSKGSWEIKFEAPADATGRRKTIFRTVKGSKREAQAKLVELQSEAARGGLVDHSRETLGEFLIRWDRDWVAINVSPKTRERWNQLRVHQIAPRLGGAPLQRIKPSHLAELYSTLMREGGVGGKPLAPVTVGHCHRLLIQQNSAAVARPPRVPDEEIEIPTESEIAAVLGHLRERDRQLYTLGVVTLATGIQTRRGVRLDVEGLRRWRRHAASRALVRDD